MKQKLKNLTIFTTLLFGIYLITISCQEENFDEQTEVFNQISYKVVSLENTPVLKQVIKNIKNVKPNGFSYDKTTSNSKSTNDIDIDIDKIIQYTNETGYSTYTFKIENEATTINFKNLHLVEVENGYIAYILSYEPNPEWYYSNLASDGSYYFDIKNYQGEITKYSLEWEVIWSTNEDLNKNSSNKGISSKTSGGGSFSTVCTYTPEPPTCDEGNHDDSTGWNECDYSNGGWSWNESCITVWTSGGGEAGSDPDSGNGDVESGGTTSDGTDCTYVSGTSIVDSLPITGTAGDCAPNTTVSLFSVKLDEVFVDQEFKNNPCLFSVYEAMGKTTKFQEYLQNFEADASVAHLRFKYDENFSDNFDPEYQNAIAVTEAPIDVSQNYNIHITFNGDGSLPSSIHGKPKLIIATAFIHEMIHAEMYRKMLAVAQQPNLNFPQWYLQDPNAFKDFKEELKNNFFGIWNYYNRYVWDVPPGQEPSSPQHHQMAEKYRTTIKTALAQYDNNQHTDAFYNALAWTGLMGTGNYNSTTGLYGQSTAAWVNTPQAERISIHNTITNFQQNDTDTCD